MKKIPETLPTKIADRALAASGAHFTPVIMLEMTFDFRLDEQRLALALDLAMDALPILGCRFAPRMIRPRWERVAPSARSIFTFTEREAEYDAFKSSRIDFYSAPQVAACLLRAASTDRLLLKVSHLAADAAGVKDVAAKLSSIYNRLGAEPDFRPDPEFSGSRSFWQVVRHVPWYAFARIFFNYLKEVVASMLPPKSVAVPVKPSATKAGSYSTRHIDREALAAAVRYAKPFNATINDLLLAAIFRANSRVGAQDAGAALRIGMTIDLRRYLPGGRAASIANLSAIEVLTCGTAAGDGFGATLSRITGKTQKRKSSWLGLSTFVSTNWTIWLLPFPMMKHLMKHGWESLFGKDHSPDLFTNMGAIPAECTDFGGPAARAWLLPPCCDLPMLFSGCSGYDGSLSISANLPSDPENQAMGERFLDLVVSELTGAV